MAEKSDKEETTRVQMTFTLEQFAAVVVCMGAAKEFSRLIGILTDEDKKELTDAIELVGSVDPVRIS